MFRLQKYFTQAAVDSNPLSKKIYFRDDDFFQELPESINKYIDSMEKTRAGTTENEDTAA